MRTSDRRIHVQPLLAAVAVLAVSAVSGPARAQDPEPRLFDCGPSIVKPGDLAAVNVGYPARNTGNVELLVRLLDASGAPLVERVLRLAPGQSQTVRHRVESPDSRLRLVRGEFLVQSGPERVRLLGTFQVFGGLGLTYGPHLVCSGDTGSRGPA
jgi:hypothetical protein